MSFALVFLTWTYGFAAGPMTAPACQAHMATLQRHVPAERIVLITCLRLDL